MQFQERTSLNKFLLVAYILSVAAIPMAMAGIIFIENEVHTWKFIDSLARFMFFFASLPAFIVYASHLIKRIFPRENKKAFLMLFSMFLPLLIYAYNSPKNILEYIITGALPVYLGLNFILIAAFFIIPFRKKSGKFNLKEFGQNILALIIAFAIIFPTLFLPAIYVFIYNLEISVDNIYDYRGIIKLVFSILLVAYFNFKPIKQIVKEHDDKRH